MRFLRLIFIYRFGLFIALLPGVRPGFDASCLKILFGFPRYSDCRWRFIDRRRSLHRGIRAAALALPCVSCRIIAARGRRSNRPHIGSAGICGCRCRSCRMELPDHRLRIGRQPANEVDDAFSGLSPVDQTVVFEDFGCRPQRCVLVGLYDGGDLSGSDPFNGLHDQIGSDGH